MKTIKRYWPAILSLMLILGIGVYALGFGQREWIHMENSRMIFPEGLERGESGYGVMNEGPALTLGAGLYTIRWSVETDGQGAILIQTTNEAALTPSRVNITPENLTGSVTVNAIDQLYNLQILVDYESGSYFRVREISLIGGMQTDGVFLSVFALLTIALLNVLWARGWLTPQRRGELIILLFVVVIASIPTFKANLNGGHDGTFHTDRLLNMLNAIRSGQFPARLGAYMENQYGAVTSTYYPELFLYFPAAMMLCGASLNFSMHVFLISINLVTALVMYYSAGRMFKDSHAGVISAVLYTLCAYRILDMYTRFSVGEALAMAFVPLFLYALYEVVLGDKRRWKLLGVSAMAIYQSHMISTAICGVFAVLVCVMFIVKVVMEKRLGALMLAAVSALGLCLYALIPLYTYNQTGVETGMMMRGLEYHLIAPAQLFLSADPVPSVPTDSTLKDMALVIGLPLIVGASGALYTLVTKEKRSRMDWMAFGFVVFGAIFAVMTTTLFPWGVVSRMTNYMVGYIQFPWRLLMMTSVCLSLAGGYGIACMTQQQKGAAQLAVFALCASLALPQLSAETRKDNYVQPYRLPMWDQLYQDYTLKDTMMHKVVDKSILTEGVEITGYEKFGTQIMADIASEAGGTVTFPLFAFDGYIAELDGMSLEIGRGDNNRMEIAVPAGAQGRLTIRFVGRKIWRVGEAVSLLTAAALIVHACAQRKKNKGFSR